MGAVLPRKTPNVQDEKITRYGKITLDKKARRVCADGKMIPLTLKEYELLIFFN